MPTRTAPGEDANSETLGNAGKSLPAEIQSAVDHIARHVAEAVRIEIKRVNEPEPLLDIGTVAKILNVSVRTAEKIVAKGQLLTIWVEGQRRFSRAGVQAYLRTCEGRKLRNRSGGRRGG